MVSTTTPSFSAPSDYIGDSGVGLPGSNSGISGTEAGAAGDSSKNSISLSTGGMIAIIVVVVVVTLVGSKFYQQKTPWLDANKHAVSTTVLFFIAKKREWKVRERLRQSARKVAAALTPRRSQFPDSVKRSVAPPRSGRSQTANSRDGILRSSSEDLEKGYSRKEQGKKSRR